MATAPLYDGRVCRGLALSRHVYLGFRPITMDPVIAPVGITASSLWEALVPPSMCAAVQTEPIFFTASLGVQTECGDRGEWYGEDTSSDGGVCGSPLAGRAGV